MYTQTTRPTPDGFQHAIELRLRNAPASRHTDPLAALDDMATGLTQPVVEVIKEHADGGVLVRVSVFIDNADPSPHETAALEGLAAELRYADALTSGR